MQTKIQKIDLLLEPVPQLVDAVFPSCGRSQPLVRLVRFWLIQPSADALRLSASPHYPYSVHSFGPIFYTTVCWLDHVRILDHRIPPREPRECQGIPYSIRRSAEASGPKQQARFCSLYQRQAPFQVRIGSMRREFKTMAKVVKPPGMQVSSGITDPDGGMLLMLVMSWLCADWDSFSMLRARWELDQNGPSDIIVAKV